MHPWQGGELSWQSPVSPEATDEKVRRSMDAMGEQAKAVMWAALSPAPREEPT